MIPSPQLRQTPGMRPITKIHFVGIGGAGMSGIAEVMLNLGYQISGSDVYPSRVTQRLEQLGVTLYTGHDPKYIETVDVVVRSSAIPMDNVEIEAARQKRLPIVARAQMLGELMRFRYGIAVAGTHGKTTTTSLTASLLTQAGLDPTYVIGGLLKSSGVNAQLGKGDYIIAEADESDASFLFLKPMMTVVTNIDADHLEAYDGKFETLERAFLEFIHHLPFYGMAMLCLDDPNLRSLIPQVNRPFKTYGFSEDADIQVLNYRQEGLQSFCQVKRKWKEDLLDVTLNLPGRHNMQNALAAIGIATECGVDDDAILAGLEQFSGVGRRCQTYDHCRLSEGEFTLVDDYGHHPREIDATIQALRQAWPDRRLVMVFQPHRYSRTKQLLREFTHALSNVDKLLLLDVYPAGESPIEGGDSLSLLQQLECQGFTSAQHLAVDDQFADRVTAYIQPNDVVVMQGAGTIGRLVQTLVQTSVTVIQTHPQTTQDHQASDHPSGEAR